MATRLLPPGYQILDANGNPVSGALLYTYQAGTSIPKNTYSDGGATIPNANPIVADAAGRFGNIFAEEGDYRLVMETSTGVVIFTADPVEGAGAAGTVPGAGTRNVILNGGMAVNQRALTTVADDAYCLDRWYALAQSGNVDITQQALQTNGIPNNIRLTQPDVGTKRIGLAQIVESGNCFFLRGSDVVLSGMVRSSLAAPLNYAILAWTGGADVVTSDVVNDWTSTSYTAGGFFIGTVTVQAVGSITPSAAIWTPIPTITTTMSGSLNNAIVMFWTTNATAQSATIDISNVQLEQGTEATSFEYLTTSAALTSTQRYWRKIQSSLQWPAPSATALSQGYVFDPQMRITPTVTLSATVAARANIDAAYPVATNATSLGMTVTILSAAGGDAYDLGRVWAIDAEL